jgi:hypothetical protein
MADVAAQQLLYHRMVCPSSCNSRSRQFSFRHRVCFSPIAIVIGGYGFAHGEPGAKKALAGVAAGTGIAVMAANVPSCLWGV